MNMPLLSPGMNQFICICLLILATVAVTLFLTRYQFKKTKNRKRLLIAMMSLAGLVVAYVMFYTTMNMIGRSMVQTQLDKMRQQKIPVDLQDIVPKMPANNADNGAYYYKAAFELIHSTNTMDQIFDLVVDKNVSGYDIMEWPEKQRVKMLSLLESAEITQAIDLFRTGSKRPYAVYKRDYNKTFEILLPELNPFRNMFRILCLKSSALGTKSDPDAGYALIADGLRAITQFETEPILITQLVNIACNTFAISTINSMIQRNGISTRSARELLVIFDKINFNRSIITALSGETVFGRELIEGTINGKYTTRQLIMTPEDKTPEVLLNMWRQSWPLFYQDYSFYLKKITEISELFSLPYWETKDKRQNWNESLKPSIRHIITRMLLPALTTCRTKTARAESEIAGTKLTLALYIYKNEHGAFPDTLAVIAPSILKEIPVDPITGNAFEYSKKGNTFTLSCAWFVEREMQKKKK